MKDSLKYCGIIIYLVCCLLLGIFVGIDRRYDSPTTAYEIVNPPETKIELIATTPEHAKVYRIENPKTIVPTVMVVAPNGSVSIR
jgi:hypothetical protein